jgi:hypothetical protein
MSSEQKLAQACDAYLQGGNLAPIRRAVVGEYTPLADAARDILKGGRHDGPCEHTLHDGACRLHVGIYRARRARLERLTKTELENEG